MTPHSVGRALAHAHACGIARLDAQLLLAHVVRQERSWVIANDDRLLSPNEHEAWLAAVQRRADGVPLAYLRGSREFHGLSLRVTPDVLIPRPETETLVDWAIECVDVLRRTGPPRALRVLDLGTGSGAVALAVKHARPACDLTGVDVSSAALDVACGNAAALRLVVRWLCGSWFNPVSAESFDIVLSNPPYIADDDPHLHALRHEPLAALTAGPDGLAALRHLCSTASLHLVPGGWLILEHGMDQAPPVGAMLQECGYTQVASRPDLAGKPRCTAGRWNRS